MTRRTLLIAVVAAVAVAGCSDGFFGGSGETTTENRDVEGFESIELKGSGDLFVELGSSFSVEVTADESRIDRVTTELRGERLVIDQEGLGFGGTSPTIRITLPSLYALHLSGSGTIRATDLTSDLELQLDGSGDIVVTGAVDHLEASLSGSGRIDATGLTAENGEVSIAGSGDIDVFVTGQLEAEISGSGTVTYLGDPKITQTITGSGSIDRG